MSSYLEYLTKEVYSFTECVQELPQKRHQNYCDVLVVRDLESLKYWHAVIPRIICHGSGGKEHPNSVFQRVPVGTNLLQAKIPLVSSTNSV